MTVSTLCNKRCAALVALVLGLCLAGCEEQAGSCLLFCDDDAGAATTGHDHGTPEDSGGLPCPVKQIISDKCGLCHGATPAYGAPMSLTTYANFQAAAVSNQTVSVGQMVKARINATTNRMPPASNTQLTSTELSTLNGWLDQGMASNSGTCTSSGPSADPNVIDTTGLECYKLLAHADGDKNSRFPIGAATDAYYNFGFQAPWQGTVYGVVVRPVIDNAQALHHWLLYREDVADGSITPTIGQHGGGELVHGWAPGGVPMDFRRHGDVGFELPPTTYSVEIHYNSSDPLAEDASGVELCVQRTRPTNIAGLSWVGYDQGGTLSYASGICLEPATVWTGVCEPASAEPIHIVFVTPHMHKTGRHMKAVINGPNGQRVLHDRDFDFAYQITYEKEEVLMPGESITTTCTYSEPQCAGQSTTQEMCYLFTYSWPRGALADNGIEGTFMHGAGACLGQ